MILRFADHSYIDIDQVTGIRWLDEFDTGVVVIGNAKISVLRDEFDVIEKAFLWKYQYAIYNEDLVQMKGENKDE